MLTPLQVISCSRDCIRNKEDKNKILSMLSKAHGMNSDFVMIVLGTSVVVRHVICDSYEVL